MAHTATTTEFVLESVDPAALVLGDNARTDTDRALTATFCASIKKYGVLEPITAVRDGDALIVRDGQCRTLAARKAKLATVPVVVVPADDGDDNARTIARVGKQWAHNEHRTGLSGRERAAAIEQLRLAGVSPTKIAREHLHVDKATVDAALSAVGSTSAMDALAQDSLTLEQAATLATYDGDDEAVAELLTAAADGRFEHAAAGLAARADARAARAELRAGLEAQGYTVHDHGPISGDGITAAVDAGMLYTRDGQSLHGLEPAQLNELVPVSTQHVIIDTDIEDVYTDATGTEVDPSTIDWNLEHDPDTSIEPEDGYHDPRTLTATARTQAVVTAWVIVNPADHGLYTWGELMRQRRSDDTPAGGGVDGEADEDRQARLAREQADREAAEKEQRRRVLKLNKLAVAAQDVRRAKLAEIVGRKTLPKGTAVEVAGFLTRLLWSDYALLGQCSAAADAKKITRDLLGGTEPADAAKGATAERRQIINLAIAFGAYEANLPKDAWRDTGTAHARRGAYLAFLGDTFGYTFADVEQVITGQKKATDIALS